MRRCLRNLAYLRQSSARSYRTIRRPISEAKQKRAEQQLKLEDDAFPVKPVKQEKNDRPSAHTATKVQGGSKSEASASLEEIYQDSEPVLTGYQCPGCGSKYQYMIPNKPGYVPYPVLMNWSVDEKYSSYQEYIYCSRCTDISTSEEVQKYSVTEKKFESIITNMIKQRATAIIVCDITSFPMSLPPLSLIPRDMPVILCLNKCDLISNDSTQFQKLVTYYTHCVELSLGKKLNIEHVQLISAVKGMGLSKMRHLIYHYLFYNKDRLSSSLYLLGCANAGKSTLFNSLVPLLTNDLQGQSTVSHWPGTTVHNLSLRVPYPHQDTKDKKELDKEAKQRFDDLLDEELDDEDMEISPPQLPVPHVDEAGKWFHSQLMDQITKERGRHLVDTPGVLPAADLTNYLTPEGLKALRATDTYVTRVVKLSPGESMYLTSLARIDYIAGSGQEPILLTFYTPTELPSKVGLFEELDSKGLDIGLREEGVPILQNKLYLVHNMPGWRQPSGDLQLGPLGWCSVKLMPEGQATLAVSSVNLSDINYRTPSLLLDRPDERPNRTYDRSND